MPELMDKRLPCFKVCLYFGDAGSWELCTVIYAADDEEAVAIMRKKADRLWWTTARVQFEKCAASVVRMETPS